MDDLIQDFLTETNESLDELDNDLVTLEQNPNDVDLLSKIFRLMHTIKGTCGFLDLPKLEKVAHHAENVLGRFRDGDLEVTPAYVTLIFESLDAIKYISHQIEVTGKEPDRDYAGLIEKLDAVYEGRDGGDTAAESSPAESGNDEPSIEDIMGAAAEETSSDNGADSQPAPSSEAADKDDGASVKLEVISNEDEDDGQDEGTQTPAPDSDEAATIEAEEPPTNKTEPPAQQAADAPTTATAPPTAVQSLRVNVDVLENLMTMVSELVLTRNQLLQILRIQSESDFTAPLQRLNHVVSDLQEGVMQTRMQPIGNAWGKLPRIIRDLSIELDKKIDLKMVGQDTELDRQVLDLIKDPLTHMVRNSADHGIEDPQTRLAAGKPETGTVLLHAYHEGGHIIIKIQDDGKGLSTQKIKEKIIDKGLASESELEGLTTQQIQQFIFKAGFSTAEKVTSVSGRGVGMDVVRTNIEKIGGSIELTSVEGKGSTFIIKIPLTLAIVSALIVEAGSQRFAIPQLAVRELVMASGNGENRIENIKGTPVFRLRNHLLPLVSLDQLLKLGTDDASALFQNGDAAHTGETGENKDEPSSLQNNEEAVHEQSPSGAGLRTPPQGNQYIIVTQVGNYSFGIVVDKVFDTEEIVVKPVAKILRDIDIFSGNTILGDGSVIMILDPNGIARATGEMETGDANAADNLEDKAIAGASSDKISLLLFAAGDKAPKAVPLSLVARIENIELSNIEHSGGQMVIQYRGSLMPLLPFSNAVDLSTGGEKPLLVFSDKERQMGLIVDKIIDITEEHINIEITTDSAGLMGSAIIHDQATDVIDTGHYLNRIYKDWFKDHDDSPFQDGARTEEEKRSVLLVDDSPFFRNMITPLLLTAGYQVTSLESATDALKLCEKGHTFDVIISDIEMPDMNGFEFAEKVKETSKWQNTPLVALTSHATPEDINRGHSVGFEQYIPKFDRDTLLNTISQTLAKHG